MTVREWINLWNGRAIDEDGAYGNQCWDLAAKYCKDIIGCPRLPTRPGGDGFAKDCYEQFLAPLPQYFDRIANVAGNPNQVPLPGDLIVFGENGFGGHIAIVVEAKPGASTVKVFQQNAPVGQLAGIGSLSYKGCLGWLAPKTRPQFDAAPAAPAPTAATPSMPGGEWYTIQDGNTFWGLEEVWGLAHGTLQSLNAAQDPRKLRIGQSIRIRPASAPAPAAPAPAVEPEFYKIKRGDTFWDLENTWGMPHGTLQNLNPDQNPRTLQIGQDIRIKAAVAPPPPAPTVAEAPAAPAAVAQDDQAVQKAQSASTAEDTTPAPAEPAPALAPQPQAAIPELTFWQKHFNKQKILLDLGALGTAIGGFIAWLMGHYELLGMALNIVAGLIFGGNRFKGK